MVSLVNIISYSSLTNPIPPDFKTCQIGTQQSPIPLTKSQGSSTTHTPSFDYTNQNATGSFKNWGFGPSFTLSHPEGDLSGLPSMTFEENGLNETVYLTGWHVHAPSDHTVDGLYSKAELHFVHKDINGKERAVVGFRINPGTTTSKFFQQLPAYIGFKDTTTTVEAEISHELALQDIGSFSEFWTYKGGLTSPPCTEGLRWFVSQDVLSLNVQQMQALLGVSVFATRAEQDIWLHEVNV